MKSEIIPARFLLFPLFGAILLSCNHDAADLLFDKKKIREEVSITPVVTGVTSPVSDGTYSTNSIIEIHVVFNTTVVVTGTPQLIIKTGTPATTNINYTSGSGTSTLIFTYTVAALNSSADLDYVSASALILNGGAISGSTGLAGILTLPAPGAAGSLGANRNIVIDTTVAAPTVTGINSVTPNATYTTGGTISIQVQFSSVVNVTGTPQLNLSTGSPATTAVNYVSGSGTNMLNFTYTVATGNSSADLDYTSTGALVLNGGTIVSGTAPNPAAILTLPAPGAGGSLGANKAIIIDAVAPTVTSVNSATADGTYTVGQSIAIQVVFSETVNVTGTPQLALNVGGAVINYASGSASNTLVFTYTVSAGHNVADLDYLNTTALSLNGGTIQDGINNNATLTLASPGAAGSLGANKNIRIDTTPPTVTNVTSAMGNGNYTTGANITIQVVFSKAVNVTGTPQLALQNYTLCNVLPVTAGVWTADYISGTGSTILVFQFTATGNCTNDLDYQNTTSLGLNGGTIQDLSGINATLTLPAPASAGSLGANKNITVN